MPRLLALSVPRSWVGVVLAVVACGAVGCGDAPNAGPDAGLLPDAEIPWCADTPDAAAGRVACPEGAGADPTGDVTGTWLNLQQTLSLVRLAPGLSQVARNVYIQEIKQEGTKLTVTDTQCIQDVRDPQGGDLLRVKVKAKYLEKSPPQARLGSLTKNDKGEYAFVLDRHYVVRAWKLGEGEIVDKAALPVKANDPRVFDLDEDGNPGFTLITRGLLENDLYVVERDYSEYQGTMVCQDRIEGGAGSARFDVEQSYLGALDPAILDDVSKIIPQPDSSQSRFKMVRVTDAVVPPSEKLDCAWVRKNLLKVFPDFYCFGNPPPTK
jgi:hypothetical protein